jgi:hypothetical protein
MLLLFPAKVFTKDSKMKTKYKPYIHFIIFLILSITNSHLIADDIVINPNSGQLKNENSEYPGVIVIDYPGTGVEIGNGWFSNSARKSVGNCITFKKVSSGGQEATVAVSKIEDSDTLINEMNVSYGASAKASFGKIGSGSVSGKMSFIKKSKIENSSINFLVKAEVQNGVEYASWPDKIYKITLNKIGSSLKNDKKKFYEYCGDTFVSAIERGAELYALYKLKTGASDTSTQVKKSITASGSYMGFSGSANYSSDKLSKIIEESSVSSVQYYHTSHRGLTLPFDLKSIETSVQYLGNALNIEDSYPYRVHLMNYSQLPDFNQGFDYGSVLNTAMEAYRLRVQGMVNKLDHIIKNPEEYSLSNRKKDVAFYKSLQDEYKRRELKVSDQIIKCFFDKERNSFSEFTADELIKCANKDDGRFYDYFLRTQMPIHVNFIREKSVEEAKTQAELQKYINRLNSRYKNEIVEYDRRARRCPWGFGRGGICGHDNVPMRCGQVPWNGTCKNIQSELRATKIKLNKFNTQLALVLDADSRYIYWIDEISRERRRLGLDNGYLSNKQLRWFKNAIYCQYPDLLPERKNIKLLLEQTGDPNIKSLQNGILNSIVSVFGVEKAEEYISLHAADNETYMVCPNLEKRIFAGEEFNFVNIFNKNYKKSRDITYLKNLRNIIGVARDEVKSTAFKIVNKKITGSAAVNFDSGGIFVIDVNEDEIDFEDYTKFDEYMSIYDFLIEEEDIKKLISDISSYISNVDIDGITVSVLTEEQQNNLIKEVLSSIKVMIHEVNTLNKEYKAKLSQGLIAANFIKYYDVYAKNLKPSEKKSIDELAKNDERYHYDVPPILASSYIGIFQRKKLDDSSITDILNDYKIISDKDDFDLLVIDGQ